jgi:hypothetical protein
MRPAVCETSRQQNGTSMSLRRCELPGDIAQIAALSVNHTPTAIIGCQYTARHESAEAPRRHIAARSVAGVQSRNAEILGARSADPLIAHNFKAESLRLIQASHSGAFKGAYAD